MFGNITTESKKQQLEIQDLKERLLSKGSTISTIEKNLTLNEKIQEVKLMLEATSTSNKHIIFSYLSLHLVLTNVSFPSSSKLL